MPYKSEHDLYEHHLNGAEIKETVGEINISYNVNCPHCCASLDDHWQKDWFYNTVGWDFPIDDGYGRDHNATCPECKKDFVIKGFRH